MVKRSRGKNWNIKFEKPVKRGERDTTVKAQLIRIAETASRNKSRGLRAAITDGPTESEINGVKVFTGSIRIVKQKVRNAAAADAYYEKALLQMRATAQRHGWRLVGDDDNKIMPLSLEEISGIRRDDFRLPPLTEEAHTRFFGRIYERDPQIRTIYSSIQTAEQSKFKKRRHCLLYGPPACGKSEILRAFTRWFNVDAENVLALDATTTTKAGLERLILERAQDYTLPPILYLEEIEKHEPKNLLCLLQVMDHRARIQRTMAFTGNQEGQAPIVIWATCNDLDCLRAFAGGALWSRFDHHIYCQLPDRELVERILLRELAEMEVPEENWQDTVQACLVAGFDTWGVRDTRQLVGLLDGWRDIEEHLADQKAIFEAKKLDQATLDKVANSVILEG